MTLNLDMPHPMPRRHKGQAETETERREALHRRYQLGSGARAQTRAWAHHSEVNNRPGQARD